MSRCDHLIADNKIGEHVHSMAEKGPGLSAYARPSAKSDVPFSEAYRHPPGGSSCTECDKSRAVYRPTRGRFKVHYGLIASGDSVLKSAELRREAVSSLGDVLCFEMEAAGLMTEFPASSSDYADFHKNDE